MLKKVFIIIIIILSFVFYGCSSMPDARNSTVLLYVSRNIEGPIYIPRADSGKEYDKPVDNTKASKKEDKTTATKTTKTDTKEDKTKTTTTSKADTSKTEDKTTTTTAKADTSKKQQEKVDSSKRNDITYYTTNTYNGYQTRVTDGRGEMLILEKPIRFAFEKYNVTSAYNESIKYVADYLKENTNVRMVVEGHTDRVGPKKFNKGLSSRRSRAVTK